MAKKEVVKKLKIENSKLKTGGKNWTIVACSGSDLKKKDVVSEKVDFETVPLIITLSGKDWVDEEKIDMEAFLKAMKDNKDAPKTACPSPDAFREVFEKAEGDNIICITISAKLSGTFNAARLGAIEVMEANPNKKIHILDSKSAACAEHLLVLKTVQLIESGVEDFDMVVKAIEQARIETQTRFLLQNLSNLVKTGRMSKVKGIVASALNIKLVCGDNGDGEIKQFDKAIGTKKAMSILADFPREKAESGCDIPVIIHHANNSEDAETMKQMMYDKYGFNNVIIKPMRGLATFYANDKGLIIAY